VALLLRRREIPRRSDFNADAVIWNLDQVLNDKAPQFDKRQSAQVKTACPRSRATPRSTTPASRSRPDGRFALPLSDALVPDFEPGAI